MILRYFIRIDILRKIYRACQKIDQWQVELKQNKIYYEKNFALEPSSRKDNEIKMNEKTRKMLSYLFYDAIDSYLSNDENHDFLIVC